MGKKEFVVIDTCVWVEIIRKSSPRSQEAIFALKTFGRESVAVNSIIMCEIFSGCRNKNELNSLKGFFDGIKVFPITIKVEEVYSDLIKSYSLSHNLELPDAIIAATALANEVQLYTYNIKDFSYIPNLHLAYI